MRAAGKKKALIVKRVIRFTKNVTYFNLLFSSLTGTKHINRSFFFFFDDAPPSILSLV
jgi:hypothetical protein